MVSVEGYLMLLHALGTLDHRGPRSRRRCRRIVRELLANYYRHRDSVATWRNLA